MGVRSRKKFLSGPCWGGRKKLKVDCLVVTNSTNCFMLFIVKCDKIISAATRHTHTGYILSSLPTYW